MEPVPIGAQAAEPPVKAAWDAGRGGPRVETVRLNTALDAADAVMCWVLVARRRDLGRGALTVAVFASVVTWQWWRLLRRMERAEAGG